MAGISVDVFDPSVEAPGIDFELGLQQFVEARVILRFAVGHRVERLSTATRLDGPAQRLSVAATVFTRQLKRGVLVNGRPTCAAPDAGDHNEK